MLLKQVISQLILKTIQFYLKSKLSATSEDRPSVEPKFRTCGSSFI